MMDSLPHASDPFESSAFDPDVKRPIEWTSRSGLRRMSEIVLLFVAHRIAVLWVTGWGAVLDTKFIIAPWKPPIRPPGLTAHLSVAVDRLCMWDCGWYASIASDGYTTRKHAAFFPLFPMLGRLVAHVTELEPRWALVLVANAAALVALIAATDFVESVRGERVARWFTVLWLLWPFSLFLAAGYAESLMVAGVAVAFALGGRGNWWGASVALAVGVLARHLAVLAIPALALHYVYSVARPRVSDVLALSVPAFAVGLYLLFLDDRFGDPFVFYNVRTAADREWIPASLWDFLNGKPFQREVSFMVASSPPLIIGAGALWARKAQHSLAVWATLHALVVAKVGLTGMGRFLAVCFALFIPLAAWAAKRPERALPVAVGFAIVQGLCIHLYAHHYWLA